MITSDTDFILSFPHMAAIALARTNVIAFSNNNYKSEVRGRAFIKARKQIEKALWEHRKKRYFIGIVGMTGTFRIKVECPLPERKTCDAKDWESYERVCQQEGGLALSASSLNKMKTTNENPIPHIPLKFEDAIAAALETPPERKPKKQPSASRRSREETEAHNGEGRGTGKGRGPSSKYPPAEPGALDCEPLEAAVWGR